jgi:MFS family permease
MLADAGAAITFYFAGRLIRRFGEFRLVIGGAVISNIVSLFSLFIPTVFSPVLMSSVSLFYGVNTVARQSLIQREFTDKERGTMGSLNSLAGSLIFAVFSFGLGALADRVGIVSALILATLLSLIPMTLYWRVLRPVHHESTGLKV